MFKLYLFGRKFRAYGSKDLGLRFSGLRALGLLFWYLALRPQVSNLRFQLESQVQVGGVRF